MKKVISVFLVTMISLCGCSIEKFPIKESQSITLSIEEDYTVNLTLVSIQDDYFEVAVTKETPYTYFHWEEEYLGEKTEYDVDLAFLADDLDYVLVNDSERVEYVSFSGGIAYGVKEVFLIKSFDESVNLKFYINKGEVDKDYVVNVRMNKAKDYGATKINATGNREIDSKINGIRFIFEE